MSSSRRSAPVLVALACPTCGGNLDPLPSDLIFPCAACGGVSELDGTRTIPRVSFFPRAPKLATERQAEARAPAKQTVGLIHLPFWRLEDGSITPAFNGSRLLTLTRFYTGRARVLAALPAGRSPRGIWGGRIGSSDARRVAALAADRTERSASKQDSRRDGAVTRLHVTPDHAGMVITRTTTFVSRESRDRATPDDRSVSRDRATRDGRTGSHGPGDAPHDALLPGLPGEGATVLALPFMVEPTHIVCAITGLHIYLETIEGAKEILARWGAVAD